MAYLTDLAFRYRLRDMRKEWNGLLVGKDEWEEKHPQLEPLRVPPDPQAIEKAQDQSQILIKKETYNGGLTLLVDLLMMV